jgi:hypothetical protein
MFMNQRAVAAARRNVVQSIGRFLDGLAQKMRVPTLWESWRVEDAILLLEVHDCSTTKRMLMRAEEADLFGTLDAVAKGSRSAQMRSVVELRRRLAVFVSKD